MLAAIIVAAVPSPLSHPLHTRGHVAASFIARYGLGPPRVNEPGIARSHATVRFGSLAVASKSHRGDTQSTPGHSSVEANPRSMIAGISTAGTALLQK